MTSTCARVVALVALAGCGAAPAPVATGTEPAVLDVDDCSERVSGFLYTTDGALLFSTAAPVYARASEDDEVLEEEDEEALDGEGPFPEWSAVPTVVALPRRAGSTSGLRVSPPLPASDFGALAVVGDDGLPSALVRLGADPSRELEVLFETGGPLWLLGTVGELVMLLVADGEDAAVVAIGRALERGAEASYTVFRERFRSAAFTAPFLEHLEHELRAGLPFVAPVGTDALLMPCEEDAWCLFRVGEAAITVEHVAGPALSPNERAWGSLQIDAAGAISAGDAGPIGLTALTPSDPPEGSALPESGALRTSVPFETEGCLLRSGIDLPALAGTGEGDYPTASLIEVPHEPGANAQGVELYVRGTRLEIGLAYQDDGGEGFAHARHLALAIPPGRVEVTPVLLGGVPVLRVRIAPAIPVSRWHQCVLGRIVVRVTSGAYGSHLHHERYWEDGYCE